MKTALPPPANETPVGAHDMDSSRTSIRVAHLTTELAGGAGIAAGRLHSRMVQQGLDSRLIYGRGTGAFPASERVPTQGGPLRNLCTKIHDWNLSRRSVAGLFTSALRPGYVPFRDSRGGGSPDLLHLHWMSNWMHLPRFFRQIPRELPIVWSLHDLNPITGGCHLPGDCRGFATDCSACPMLRGALYDPQPGRRNHQVKEALFRRHRFHLVANSRWMLQAARDSSLGQLAKSLHLIHLGVDTDAFQPRDRTSARQLLGIPEGKFVIAFGAGDLNDSNKNLRLLSDAVARSPLRDGCHFLLFGGGWPSFPLSAGATRAGWIENERCLSLVYSAADILTMPSTFESFGLTALEATACGVPVVATMTGGLTDIVQDEVNGLLVPVSDANALQTAIERLQRDIAFRVDCGRRGRQIAEQTFSMDCSANAYMALYRDLCKESTSESHCPL